MTTVNLTFTQEEIPKINRVGGSGRAAEPWEEHLSPAREAPGVSFRVWEYAKRMSAVSRVSTVRDRLNKVVPNENWKMVVRQVPTTDPEAPETWGVYVQYDGEFTAEEMAENERLHAERSARVKASRANKPESVAAEPVSGSAPEPTPQERVQARRAAQAAQKAS